jgi:zinc protease
MLKRSMLGLACIGLLAAGSFAAAKKPQASAPKPTAAKAATHKATAPKIQFQDVKLKNGLRVILSEDHSAPVYAIALTYNVGSRNEVKGRTGFAHLFEHMMFQGSQNVGKGEHMLLVEENGGTMNGSTNKDQTNYFESLPANQLDLGLFLESDRMRSLAVTQANLDNQRNAVQEERRLRMDNQPYGKTFEVVDSTAYDNFAYKHSVIGSMEDLNAASVDDVAKFFKTYYAPNNAILTLVGDFDSKVALAKVRKYFEDIPAQPQPPQPDMTEPVQTAERRATIEDAFAQFPRLNIAYKGPRGNTPDAYALDMLCDIIGGGQSSRLYQKLVKEKQLAMIVNMGFNDSRGPGLIHVIVQPAPGKDMAEIEKVIYEELDAVKKEPPTKEEMAKVLAGNRTQMAQRMQTSMMRAMQLGTDTVWYNDPNLINTRIQKYEAVTPADLVRVANTYFKDTNRTVVTTLPKPKAAAAAQASK